METQNLDQNAKRIAALGLQFGCSDIGNMERFIGSFWSLFAKKLPMNLQTINLIFDEITACSVEAGAAELRQWARASRSKAKVSNI